MTVPSNKSNPLKPVAISPAFVEDIRPRTPALAAQDADNAVLRSVLLELVTEFNDEATFRTVFRGIALRYAGAAGCCHVIRDGGGNWDVKPEHVTGRVPRRHDLLNSLTDRCNETAARNSIQVDSLDGVDGFQAVLAPALKPNAPPEVMVLIFPDSARLGNELIIAQILAEALQLWLRDQSVTQSNWKMNSLAALVELVSDIEGSANRRIASQKAADHVARYLNCHGVAVGLAQPNMRLMALSGVADLKPDSESGRMFLQALQESMLRRESGVWPAADPKRNHLLLAHRQLAIQLQVESVYSLPLLTIDGNAIGAMVLTGPISITQSERFERFLAAMAPRVASALEVVSRAEPTWATRARTMLRVHLAKQKTWALAALLAIFMLAMLMPVSYRVRCGCSIQPTERRFAVAPFDGLVEQALVKPGDTVAAGQLLARMDGRQVRWELATVQAERQQALKKREVELAGRAIAGAMLAELESQRLAAKQGLLDHQRDHLEIRSPIDGVILSGSLDQLESSVLSNGQVIYEIGPLDRVNLQLEIPSNERAQVQPGMSVSVWVDGQEGQTIRARVARIYPRSELRNSENVFIAECEFENPGALLRPGMQGRARIDGAKRPLGWNLFHKPWGFVKSRLTWW